MKAHLIFFIVTMFIVHFTVFGQDIWKEEKYWITKNEIKPSWKKYNVKYTLDSNKIEFGHQTYTEKSFQKALENVFEESEKSDTLLFTIDFKNNVRFDHIRIVSECFGKLKEKRVFYFTALKEEPYVIKDTLYILKEGCLLWKNRSITLYQLESELDLLKPEIIVLKSNEKVSFNYIVKIMDVLKSKNSKVIMAW